MCNSRCAAPLHEPAPILVRAASAQSARPVVYLIARARLAKHVAEGLDAQAAAARYGLFVAAKQADGTWCDRNGLPYRGGTDLDAVPWAQDALAKPCDGEPATRI